MLKLNPAITVSLARTTIQSIIKQMRMAMLYQILLDRQVRMHCLAIVYYN